MTINVKNGVVEAKGAPNEIALLANTFLIGRVSYHWTPGLYSEAEVTWLAKREESAK